MDQSHGGIVLGRDAQCDIVIGDRSASRQHARIERRRDKFFVVDQSTNGTFVAFANAPEVVLRQEFICVVAGVESLNHVVKLADREQEQLGQV